MTDTPQQKAILRRNPRAQKIRKMFPEGTRVEGAPGAQGTIVRHVPGTNALGGYLVVQWDSGVVGRHSYSEAPDGKGIRKIEAEEPVREATKAIKEAEKEIQ